MSGYENSPDYGGPEPSWREAASVAPVIIIVIVTTVGAVWSLRQLLVACGLV